MSTLTHSFELLISLPLKSKLGQMVLSKQWGWSGVAMVLGKLPVPGRPMDVGRARAYCTAVGAGGGCLGHFYSPLSFLSSFFLSLGDGPT